MLVVYFPFDGDTDNETYNKIKNGIFNFDSEAWPIISNEVKDLIKHMICDEGKRYTVEKVLKHP